MSLVRPLAVLLLLGTTIQAAPLLEIHPGSTRDWVHRFKANADSTRIRLQFLDSKTRISSKSQRIRLSRPAPAGFLDTTVQITDTSIDWRVRITMAGPRSVTDSAVLRVVNMHVPIDPNLTGETIRIRQLAYWLVPSIRFPIDVQINSKEEITTFTAYYKSFQNLEESRLEHRLLNGSWEFAVSIDRPDVPIETVQNRLCYHQLWESFCGMVPTMTSESATGVTGWQGRSGFWELVAKDGTPRPRTRRDFGHAPRIGEIWTYANTERNPFQATRTSRVQMEILELLPDSASWSRILVRKIVKPDSGRDSTHVLRIALDPHRRIIRMASDSGAPWSLPRTLEGRWALGLLSHLWDSTADTSHYKYHNSYWTGEVINRTTTDSIKEMSFDKSVGLFVMKDSTVLTGVMYATTFQTATLLSHTTSSSSIAILDRMDSQIPNLAWIRRHITSEPDFVVVRIGLDGSRRVARGPNALRLLEEPGVAILQGRVGSKVVNLRFVQP